MSNNNDFFGGKDLFAYFGNNFSGPAPSTPGPESNSKDSDDPNATSGASSHKESHHDSLSVSASKDNTNVVSLDEKRMPGPIRRKTVVGTNPDSCDVEKLTDEEQEALSEDKEVDEQAADAAELGGQVVKDDNNSVAVKQEPKAEVKPEFNHSTFICYAGINRPLTKYFTDDKLALVSLEDVRKRLEKDHPELSKQRTKMDWDGKKNVIIPIVTGGKKGAVFFEESRAFFSSAEELFNNKELHPINILAATDGFYEVRENPIGVFVTRTCPEKLQRWNVFDQFYEELSSVDQLDPCREGFKLNLPKVPNQLFEQLISFFMDYADHDVEVMGVFYWNMVKKQYFLDIPFQHVSKVSVDPCYTKLPSHFIKIAEVHSHNTMKAYFSSIDDADELGTMLYGVIGKLRMASGTIRFDVQTRAGSAGNFIPLLPSAWVDCDYDNQEDSWNLVSYTPYPQKWKTRVSIHQAGGNK